MNKVKKGVEDILGGFKQFILRGNVVDLAVGIMIGGAFNTVVSKLVADIMTPLIAAVFKQPNFANFTFTIHGSQFLYGDFLNNLISFLITAITVYFFVVIPINKISNRIHHGPPPAATTKPCPECLSSIPINAHRCMYCTTIFTPPATPAAAAAQTTSSSSSTPAQPSKTL